MVKRTSAIMDCFLVILSMIPFFILAIGSGNPRYITLCFIWVGTIFLLEPSMVFEAFREINGFGRLKETDDDPKNTNMLKRVYEYIIVLEGLFLIIVGLVTSFTM